MTKFLPLLALLCVSATIFCQPSLDWAEKELEKFEPAAILEDEDGILVAGWYLHSAAKVIGIPQKFTAALQKYDRENQLIREVKFTVGAENKGLPHSILSIEGRLYLLYTEEIDRQWSLNACEFDARTLEVSREATTLATASSKEIRNPQAFITEYFPERATLLVLSLFDKNQSDDRKGTMAIYSEKLEQLHAQEIRIDIESRQLSFVGATFDEQDHLLVGLFKEMSLGGGKSESFGIIWQYDLAEKKVTSTKLDSKEGFYVKSMRLRKMDDQLVLAGFYSETEPFQERVRGIYFTEINTKNLGLKPPYIVPLPPEVLHEHLDEGNKKTYAKQNYVKEYLGLTIVDLIHWEGHGFLVVGECWRDLDDPMESTDSPQQYKTPDNWVVGGLVVTLLDESFNLLWSHPILKEHTLTTGKHGHFLSVHKNELDVFFYSSYDTDDLYGSGLIHQTIESDGSYRNQVIYDPQDADKFLIDFKLMSEVAAREYFFFAKRFIKGKTALLKI